MRPPSGTRRRATLAWGLCALTLWGAAPEAGADGPPTRHVLFLNSYRHGVEWSDDLVRGVQAVLEAQTYPVAFSVEHMDSGRFSGPTYEAQLLGLLRLKYGGRPLDAIVAADDEALRFLLEHRDELFPKVPVVFMGINNAELIARADPAGYTGLREELRTGDIVDLATTLRPATRRIVVVGDATSTAASQLDAYRAVAVRRPDLAFVFLDGGRESLEQIVEGLRNTSATDAVVTTAFTRDFSGRYFPRDDALARIAAASRAPVYSAAVSRLGQGLLAGSENGGLRYASRAALMLVAVLNGTPPAAIPRGADDIPRFVIDYAQAVRWDIPESKLPPTAIFVNRPPSFYQTNRTAIWGAAFFMLLQAAVIAALVVNIGRRRRAEQALAAQAEHLAASNADLERLNLSLRSEMDERRQAEEQLRQAQKIDAIGRLAGGVAHDFNNLLTVIGSYADILLETLDPADPGRPHAEQIRQATERASGLTHQLLAFSRKQVMQPRVVDLNVVVRGLESMVGRLIGEDIALSVRLTEQPATVVVDAGQIEQVIVNLAANGRDAMPAGGQLVIETRHLLLSAEEIADRPGMTPGAYVQLSVTDSGKGMDVETQARIFEPFFTTKGPGEGTGLGLSMAYGIVKQSGGWIWVYSEVGQGTTFKIHLPATDAPAAVRPPASPKFIRVSSGETVLLVEDQDDVRNLSLRILEREGYVVLAAASGQAALTLATSHDGRIHLLLTDVVMPGLSGREVAEQLAALRPGIRVLFMSGYTDNVIAQRGVLDPGMAFLSKPFTPETLAAKVRDVLDA
jgi:signal transduction histidine kinase/CheY-like chemotaxis protein